MYKITVAIPAYKSTKYLERALDSIIHQKPDALQIEAYVSIDESKYTDEIISLLTKKYPSVRYSVNRPKLGMSENWNHCIINSNTQYVALLHDDDYLLPNYAKTVNVILQKMNDFDVICFNHKFLRNGEVLEKVPDNKKIRIRRLRSIEYWLGGITIRLYHHVAFSLIRTVF